MEAMEIQNCMLQLSCRYDSGIFRSHVDRAQLIELILGAGENMYLTFYQPFTNPHKSTSTLQAGTSFRLRLSNPGSS